MSAELGPNIVWRCPFTVVAHNRGLSVRRVFKYGNTLVLVRGGAWMEHAGGGMFCYSTLTTVDGLCNAAYFCHDINTKRNGCFCIITGEESNIQASRKEYEAAALCAL